jgi:hypothetical protein
VKFGGFGICGIKLSVVNPGMVFISSMCGSPFTNINSLLESLSF